MTFEERDVAVSTNAPHIRRKDDTCLHLAGSTPPSFSRRLHPSKRSSSHYGRLRRTRRRTSCTSTWPGHTYYYAKASWNFHVKLPAEDQKLGEEHLCDKLKKAMYGTHGAAQKMATIVRRDARFELRGRQGLVVPLSTTGTPTHAAWHMAATSCSQAQTRFSRILRITWMGKCCIEVAVTGPERRGVLLLLNRSIRWTPGGIEYKCNHRHAEKLVEELELRPGRRWRRPPCATRGWPGAQRPSSSRARARQVLALGTRLASVPGKLLRSEGLPTDAGARLSRARTQPLAVRDPSLVSVPGRSEGGVSDAGTRAEPREEDTCGEPMV